MTETNNNPERVTIVVIQRERFSTTRRSLESLLENTDSAYPMIYVDSGSPREIGEYIARQAAAHQFRLLRLPGYQSPQHARNAAISEVSTECVVFVDNDVLFTQGWLDQLLETSERHQADVVTPLILQGEIADQTVHTAGGTVEIQEKDGHRRLHQIQRFLGKPLSEIADDLIEANTQMAEFHCVLIRREFLQRIGLFDEHFIATSEHLDFALAVQQARGSVWFTPASVVSYVYPPPVEPIDRQFFVLRWSTAWASHSEKHLFTKWQLEPDDRVLRFTRKHRRRAFASIHQSVSKIAGTRAANLVVILMDRWYTLITRRHNSGQVHSLLTS